MHPNFSQLFLFQSHIGDANISPAYNNMPTQESWIWFLPEPINTALQSWFIFNHCSWGQTELATMQHSLLSSSRALAAASAVLPSHGGQDYMWNWNLDPKMASHILHKDTTFLQEGINMDPPPVWELLLTLPLLSQTLTKGPWPELVMLCSKSKV